MSEPILTLAQGKIRGSTAISLDGVKYFQFQGIPYAKPPIGALRFKDPVPLESWDGILDASKEGNSCFNRNFYVNNILEGSEDCLYLNVYTKELGDSNTKPVLFWLHGGGFFFGSGGSKVYGPDFLLNEDVVVVTINYRLGLFGFLALEDPALGIPGNAGFKDMILALKWVHQNISKFGGDPKNVTIFGESAGSVSAHLLVLSPLSKGLFHKAIAQSGTAFSLSANTNSAKQIAVALGLSEVNDQKILKELNSKTTAEIFQLASQIQEDLTEKDQVGLFGWVVEKQSPEAFLTEDTISLILTGNYNHVPFIMGFNTVEGIIYDMMGIKGQEQNVPSYFGYPQNSPDKEEATKTMRQFYSGECAKTKRIELISDKVFIFPIIFSMINYAKTSRSPVYMYRLSADTTLNFLKALMNFPDIPGAFHSDDLGYLFKSHKTPEIKPGSVEDIVRRRMVRLWTNFAKFGNPTPGKDDLLDIVWDPMAKSEINLLNIDEDLTLFEGAFPESKRFTFWEELFRESPTGKKFHNMGLI